MSDLIIGDPKGFGARFWTGDDLAGVDVSLGRRTTISILRRKRGSEPVRVKRFVLPDKEESDG